MISLGFAPLKQDQEEVDIIMADITTKTPDLTLVRTEQLSDQQLVAIQQEQSVKTEEISTQDVKDSDLILLENNQALTTSLKVAEYFEKQHKDVLKAVMNLSGQMSTAQFCALFIESSYVAQNGKSNKMYLMNKKGFSLLVMRFTGQKALQWQIRYIDAFERMEEQLRRQQETHMDLTDQLMLQAKLNVEIRDRLNSLEGTVQQQSADIKRLQQNSNGMFLRHEMADIRQQGQLDQHETDIQKIQRLISDKGPREEVKTLISDIISKTADTEAPYSYKEAYDTFYKYVREQKKIRLSTKLSNLKRLREQQGWSKSKVEKLNCLDAVDADPAIWGAIRDAVKELYQYLEVQVNG